MRSANRTVSYIIFPLLLGLACAEREVSSIAPKRPSVQRGVSGECFAADWPLVRPFGEVPAPSLFELTNVPAAGQPGVFVIDDFAENPPYRFATWRRVGQRQIELQWSTGYFGVTMMVAPSPDPEVLIGTARMFSDVPEPSRETSLRLRRTTCLGPRGA